jgi:glycosyltransferase involved in cell wall biosynthesis
MMMDLPLVSIVTPSYNQAQFLEETIQSVLDQDYPGIEYLVIDGGSTDGSVEIIKKYTGHLAYWVSKPDEGQSDAINKGFEASNGSILAWLNSDDLLEPSAVSIAVYFLEKHPDIGMVFGDRVYIDGKNNTIRSVSMPSFRPWHLRWGAYIPQETAFWRRELFFQVGKLDTGLRNSMDTDLWFRINKVARIKHIPAFLGRYRQHAATITSQAKLRDSSQANQLRRYSKIVRDRYIGRFPTPWMRSWFLRINKLRVPFERRTAWHQQETREIQLIQMHGYLDAIKEGRWGGSKRQVNHEV